MKDLFDKKSDLTKAMDEYFKRVEAIQKLPEYQDFLAYKSIVDGFNEFINKKRLENSYELIKDLLDDEDELADKEISEFIERIQKLEKRLSDSAWKRHESFCSSNIMDHIWEVFKEYGKEADVDSMFGTGAYTLGKYTMESYSGQGEYGYSIYVNKRIF